MKKIAVLVNSMLLCFCLGSCISFRIIPPFPLEGYVETMALCSRVDESGELLEPLGIKVEYQLEEESVYCFIELKNISRRIRMRWRWYGPDKTEFRDSGDVLVNREEQYLETLTAYDELRIDSGEEDNVIGRWTVIVLIDGQLVSRREFSINKNE